MKEPGQERRAAAADRQQTIAPYEQLGTQKQIAIQGTVKTTSIMMLRSFGCTRCMRRIAYGCVAGGKAGG